MNSAIRPVVWLVVILAAVGVGWYMNQVPMEGPEPPPSSPGKYLFLAGGSDPYWELCISGAQAAADESGAKLEVLKPTGEGEEGLKEQIEWLTSMETENFDGLAIGPINPERQTALINSAAEKFPVVTVDSDVPQSRRMFYIGSSNLGAGMLAGSELKKALPEGGSIIVLMASEAKTNAVERKQGLEDSLSEGSAASDAEESDEEPKIEIVDYYYDRGDFDVCRQNVIDATSKHADLAAIVCTFGYHGPIVLDALKDVSRASEIKVIAFDEDERTLKAVEDGRIYATIVQDPFLFGVEAVSMLEKVRQGKFLSLPVSNGAVGVHCKAIDKDNLGEFREKLSTRLESASKEEAAEKETP